MLAFFPHFFQSNSEFKFLTWLIDQTESFFLLVLFVLSSDETLQNAHNFFLTLIDLFFFFFFDGKMGYSLISQ
jgi:hypothetical protein